MKQDVNYIKHHKAINLKLIEMNLNCTHISLYNALFLIWNECGFDSDLSVNRNDVMKLSKIGSANTYTKCLKELHNHKLINYKPSYNPLIGSKIHLYRFDKGTDNSTDNGSVKSSSNGSGNGSDTLSKQLNKETIKLLNTNYKEVNDNLYKWLKLKNEEFTLKKVIIDFEEVKDIFNSVCIDLPKVKTISEKRKKLIKAREKEYDLQTIGDVLKKVSESDFLNGKVKEWCANFDWIFNQSNFIKILEDNYKNKAIVKEKTINRQTQSVIESNLSGWGKN